MSFQVKFRFKLVIKSVYIIIIKLTNHYCNIYLDISKDNVKLSSIKLLSIIGLLDTKDIYVII